MAARNARCRACAEQIPWNARICPHCHEPRDSSGRPLALIVLGLASIVGLAKAEPYLAPYLTRLARVAGIGGDPGRRPAAVARDGTGRRIAPAGSIDAALGAVAVVEGGERTGSGVVVSPDGYILTSSELAADQSVKVPIPSFQAPAGGTRGGDHGFVAWRVAVEPEVGLGLVRVGDLRWTAPYVEIGDATALRPADPIVVVGFPLDSRSPVVTKGIISAAPTFLPGLDLPLIQIDAAVNPGHLGGALLDARGRLVGIVAAKIPGAERMTYAIPVNYISRLGPQVRAISPRGLSSMDAWSKARPKESDASRLAGSIAIRIVGAARQDGGLIVFLGATDDLGPRPVPTEITLWADFQGGSCVATAGEDTIGGDAAADLARELGVPSGDPLLAIPLDCPNLPGPAAGVEIRALAKGVRKPASFELR